MYLTYRVLANVINEEKEILNRGLIPFGFIIIIVRENGNETIVQNNISEKKSRINKHYIVWVDNAKNTYISNQNIDYMINYYVLMSFYRTMIRL